MPINPRYIKVSDTEYLNSIKSSFELTDIQMEGKGFLVIKVPEGFKTEEFIATVEALDHSSKAKIAIVNVHGEQLVDNSNGVNSAEKAKVGFFKKSPLARPKEERELLKQEVLASRFYSPLYETLLSMSKVPIKEANPFYNLAYELLSFIDEGFIRCNNNPDTFRTNADITKWSQDFKIKATMSLRTIDMPLVSTVRQNILSFIDSFSELIKHCIQNNVLLADTSQRTDEKVIKCLREVCERELREPQPQNSEIMTSLAQSIREASVVKTEESDRYTPTMK